MNGPLSFLVTLLPLLLAFLPPRHSTLTTSVSRQKQTLVLEFKVTPKAGMAITMDNAPWHLKLKNTAGLGLKTDDKGEFVSKDFHEKLSAFVVETSPDQPRGTVSYEVLSFICTTDKSRCYPELHKGELPWTF